MMWVCDYVMMMMLMLMVMVLLLMMMMMIMTIVIVSVTATSGLGRTCIVVPSSCELGTIVFCHDGWPGERVLLYFGGRWCPVLPQLDHDLIEGNFEKDRWKGWGQRTFIWPLWPLEVGTQIIPWLSRLVFFCWQKISYLMVRNADSSGMSDRLVQNF